MTSHHISELHGAAPDDLRGFLAARFDRALLILGDLAPALRSQTQIFVATEPGTNGPMVVGCLAHYRGFASPVVCAVADDPRIGADLLEASSPAPGAILAGNVSEPLISAKSGPDDPEDHWMTCATTSLPVTDAVEPLTPAHAPELIRLYRDNGTGFWSAEMLAFGHHHGIRDQTSGRMQAAAGVSFVLPEQRYAQIANVVTAAEVRRRGLATRCVRATIAGLHTAGIARCGLFVDKTSEWLGAWYRRLGFVDRGRFRFINL